MSGKRNVSVCLGHELANTLYVGGIGRNYRRAKVLYVRLIKNLTGVTGILAYPAPVSPIPPFYCCMLCGFEDLL